MDLFSSLSEDRPARPSRSPESDLGWMTRAATSPLSSWRWLDAFASPGWLTKMSPACCRMTKDERWEPSSGSWGSAGMGSPTECWTLNLSAWTGARGPFHSDGSVCSLSDILETQPVPRRYYLTAKACAGILRRAALRGKELPQQLARALKAVADSGPTSIATEDLSHRKPFASPTDRGGAEVGDNYSPTLNCNHEQPIIVSPIAGSLPAGGNSTGGNRPPGMGQETADTMLVAHAFDARQSDVIQYGDVTGPLDTDGHTMGVAHSLRADGFDASEDGTGRGTPLVPIAFDTTQITSAGNYSAPKAGDACDPLAALAHPPAIATEWAVRRLTPTECERLMDAPDGFTAITYRGKPASDGPRYKSLGNSQARNVMRWLAHGLADVIAIQEK